LKKLKTIEYSAFFKAVIVIMILGYTWSYLVTSQEWWVFNPETMLGIEVFPYLPLEEVLFYPLGGGLSILVYIAIHELGVSAVKVRIGYLCILLAITAIVTICTVYSTVKNGRVPWYIVSQVVLYNGLSIGLWFRKQARIVLYPALLMGDRFFLELVGIYSGVVVLPCYIRLDVSASSTG